MCSVYLSEQGKNGIKTIVKKTGSGFFYFDTSLKGWMRDDSLSLAQDLSFISREDVKKVLECFLGTSVSDSFLD